ncbi:MAG: oxidoreductase C-terminal domain-containing protein, partial [Rhodovibrionaceae bacterium]
IVVGIGATLNDELAQEAGLDCENGILVDSACRTGAEGIYAIGDVTHHENLRLGRRLRLESWENAELQAEIAAAGILGQAAACDAVPWFWTDQHGVNLQLLGYGEAWDEEVLRGTPDDGAFAAFYLRDGRIVMAALANSGRERRPLKQLIESGAQVSAAELADSSTSLRDLAKRLTK